MKCTIELPPYYNISCEIIENEDESLDVFLDRIELKDWLVERNLLDKYSEVLSKCVNLVYAKDVISDYKYNTKLSMCTSLYDVISSCRVKLSKRIFNELPHIDPYALKLMTSITLGSKMFSDNQTIRIPIPGSTADFEMILFVYKGYLCWNGIIG